MVPSYTDCSIGLCDELIRTCLPEPATNTEYSILGRDNAALHTPLSAIEGQIGYVAPPYQYANLCGNCLVCGIMTTPRSWSLATAPISIVRLAQPSATFNCRPSCTSHQYTRSTTLRRPLAPLYTTAIVATSRLLVPCLILESVTEPVRSGSPIKP